MYTEPELLELKAHIEAIQKFIAGNKNTGIFNPDDEILRYMLEDIDDYIKYQIHDEPYPDE